MKINRIEVHGLLGSDRPIIAQLNDDLNIITGRNGSGKTTLMKLAWYIVSGNILLALKEVHFRRATVETEEYSITVHKVSHNTCRIDFSDKDGDVVFEDGYDDEGEHSNAEDPANRILMATGGSVFLPTFRRIEGGFTLGEGRGAPSWNNSLFGSRSEKNSIESGLQQLSTTLSNRQHIFVASISTVDIATILLSQFTNLSDQYAQLQQETSQQVINNIKQYEEGKDAGPIENAKANAVISKIKNMIEELDIRRETIMTPIEAVRNLVQKLIRKTGITFSSRLSFGDAASAINSDLLSAGEKQMLSFICYNAFYQNCVFFIDEPELSLHVDWQRQLFSILKDQKSSNQFIVATHSPFIYNKYPDREILISADRGD